jgi:hypothetical protein
MACMIKNTFEQSLITLILVGRWGKNVKKIMKPTPIKLKSKCGEWTVETMELALGMIRSGQMT